MIEDAIGWWLGPLLRQQADKVPNREIAGTAEAGARVRATALANAQTFGHLAGGGLVAPDDWLRLIDANLAAGVAFAAAVQAQVVSLTGIDDRAVRRRRG